jgi:hypothetical protein
MKLHNSEHLITSTLPLSMHEVMKLAGLIAALGRFDLSRHNEMTVSLRNSRSLIGDLSVSHGPGFEIARIPKIVP